MREGMPKPKYHCDRCGEPSECEPYVVERTRASGLPGDARETRVCELCWTVWLKKVDELFDQWRWAGSSNGLSGGTQ